MHAEHHGHDVEAATAPSLAAWSSVAGADAAIDPNFLYYRHCPEPFSEAILDDEVGAKQALWLIPISPPAAPLHLTIPFTSLFDGDVRRIQGDVQIDPLWRLLPFCQVSALAAPDIQDQQSMSITMLASFVVVVLRRRVSLNDCALYPIVETAQALDLALRLPPFLPALGHRIVVLPDDIVHSPSGGLSLAEFVLFLLPELLTPLHRFRICCADTSGAAGPFTLSRW